MKQFVIMCGGVGSRLKLLKKNIPKCLVKINNRTLLEHQVLLAKKNNFKEIILLTGYKSSLIKNFLKRKKLFKNIKIIKDKQKLGNGGALLNALNYLDQEFCLIYCDILTNINLSRLCLYFKKKKCDFCLVVNKNNNYYDSNLIKLNKNNKVDNIYFYPHNNILTKSLYSNEAIFVVKKYKILDIKKKFYKKKTDFVKDLLPVLLKNKTKVFGYKSKEYIIDCGTPKRLKEAQINFKLNF